nr:unnamed protein product [Digitaria exilis]
MQPLLHELPELIFGSHHRILLPQLRPLIALTQHHCKRQGCRSSILAVSSGSPNSLLKCSSFRIDIFLHSELVHNGHRSLLGLGIRAQHRPLLRVGRDIRRGIKLLHPGVRLGPGGRQRAGEPWGGVVRGRGGLDGGDGERRHPPDELQLGCVPAVRVRVGEAEKIGVGGEEAEKVVVGEAERSPQRGELGDLEAAAAGEHEHPREAVRHGRLGGRDGGLLGVDERRHPLGETEVRLLLAAAPLGVRGEDLEAGWVLAEPVGGAPHHVERLEAGLQEPHRRRAGREAEEETLDLVVHDPAPVAPERRLQGGVLGG